MNMIMGFFGSYVDGFAPSRIPPWGGALVLLVAVAVAADTVLVTTAVTVRTAAGDAIASGSMARWSLATTLERRKIDTVPRSKTPIYIELPEPSAVGVSARMARNGCVIQPRAGVLGSKPGFPRSDTWVAGFATSLAHQDPGMASALNLLPGSM
jgi:hypothetical protein